MASCSRFFQREGFSRFLSQDQGEKGGGLLVSKGGPAEKMKAWVSYLLGGCRGKSEACVPGEG